MSVFTHRWFTRIADIEPAIWDSFFGSHPFTSHAFLSALEQSGCVSEDSGWQACHLAIYEQNRLVAIAPGYIKGHSYGEYVFDWAWADAYAQHGLDYYPKWLCASPFSPIEGARVAIHHPHPEQIYAYLTQLLTTECAVQGWSGWHINFCPQAQAQALLQSPCLPRLGVQFQWFNRDYLDFDAFLAGLKSSKRKVIKKERLKVQQAGFSIEWLQGKQLNPALLSEFSGFYRQTYLKRSGHTGYLNENFFQLLGECMPDKVVLMCAKKQERLIAATLSFVDEGTLYGRYWGALEEVDCLHFELCYYQGIEYCIQHHLKCFHSGAQGEHKIARGFEPVMTHSVHDIVHPDFKRAIADYLTQERQNMQRYHLQCESLLPFKKE